MTHRKPLKQFHSRRGTWASCSLSWSCQQSLCSGLKILLDKNFLISSVTSIPQTSTEEENKEKCKITTLCYCTKTHTCRTQSQLTAEQRLAVGFGGQD